MLSIEWIKEIGYLVVFVAVLFAVAWYLPKLSPRLGGTKTVTKTTTAGAFIAVPSQQDKALESDIVKPKVFSRDFVWIWEGLDKVDPYMELVVTIINSNVFPILIKAVEGRFVIDNQECAYTSEMEGTLRIPHGEFRNIRIKQRLSREMANTIIAAEGKLKISLKRCKIITQLELEKGSVESTSFVLGGDTPFELSCKSK